MNITAGLIGKGLIALGAIGATGGIAVLAKEGSKRTKIAPKNPISVASNAVEMETQLVHKEPVYSDEEFSRKVEDIMEKVGLKGWCSKAGYKRYYCNKDGSVGGLNKIKFSSKNNNQEYVIKGGYRDVGMQIIEFNDGTTFPERIIFMLGNTTKMLKLERKNASDKNEPKEINVGMNGELKFDKNKNALVWAWEDVNDLAGKVGLKCEVSKKTCTFTGGTKINIVDASSGKRNMVREVTLEDGGVEWTYGSNFNTFQGYGFKPKVDIEVKYDGGSKVVSGNRVIKISKDKYYRITRLATKVTEWYLTL